MWQLLELLDRTIRDCKKSLDKNCSEKPFGGATLLLCGEWRQILPVDTSNNRAIIMNKCLKSSILWDNVIRFELTENVRVKGTSDLAQWFRTTLLDIGKGLSNVVDKDGYKTDR